MIPEQQTEQFSHMVPKNYRKRNVWFLEMGAKESKTQSLPKTPTRRDCGSGARTMTSSQAVPMKPVQSANPKPVPVWPDKSMRWRRKYDVYICHSGEEPDCSYAVEMLSYLEQQPEKLRCFLPMRDMLAGGAVTSEMCSGLESSHCWVMLLTPHFLSDSWCKYQMHQFLAQAPCSNGRLIPVMIGLSFAQYPPEVKHMYAFKGAFNDNSVFIKIKGAILAYLKEMITVTSDKSPAHIPPSNRTPERSQSNSKPLGNSQEESSVTKESTSDTSSGISMTQEVTNDVSMGSSVTQEITSDMSMRSAVTHEVTTSGMSSRTQMTQETTSDMSMKSSVTQETTRDMSMGSSLIEFTTDVSSMTEETTSDVSSSCSITQKTTSDMSIRNSLTSKITSEITMTSSLTQETTRDMSIESSLIQEFTTDMSSRNPMTQEANSNKSLRIPLTQETTSEISLRRLVSEKPSTETSMRSSFTRQETTHDVSMSSSETSCLSLLPPIMKNRDVCTDYKCTMIVTKETPIDTGDSGIWSMTKDLHSNRIPLTQETTSEIRSRSLVSQEPSSDTSMRSSFTRQETAHDVSMSSYETSFLSLSPPIMKNRDVCTDYKCTMMVTKETPIDTGDSGIWSMTKDLHSNSEQEHSDCSDCYTSRMDELAGQDSHPQAVSSNISTVILDQNSLTSPREHQCFPNR